MDHTRTTMIQLTVLILLLGDSLLVPIVAPDLLYLKKGGCPPFTKLPSSVKVSLNISSHEAPAMSRDVRKHSMSPWEYSLDINHHRFPSTIAQAKCLHEGCVDGEGNVDSNLYSAPFEQEILVLHQEMRGCVPTFKLEKTMVTVGCTCVRTTAQKQPEPERS